MIINRYKGKYEYSYTLGMAPTMELIFKKPENISMIYVHPEYKANSEKNIFDICKYHNLPCEINCKIFNKLAIKENTFVLGVFKKYKTELCARAPHMVFVSPSDAGNLGTNIRTSIGFGFRDIAIIKLGVDIFDPKVIRASMGAIFHSRFAYYSSYKEYMSLFPDHIGYTFMLKGVTNLKDIKKVADDRFSLIFGNEATGLPDEYIQYGNSVYIEHANDIDSLNLSVAFGIAANDFYNILITQQDSLLVSQG